MLHDLTRYLPVIVAGLVAMTSSMNSHASQTAKGFIDFNLYPILSDVDNDTSLTINSFAVINSRFSYFGFINFSNQAGSGELSEINSFYAEQTVYWKMQEDSEFDLTAQINLRDGENNDRHRLGVRWRLSDNQNMKSFFDQINLKYSVNLHAIQFDHDNNYVWQTEHAFRMTFPKISEHLYLGGFIDHTFNESLPTNIPSNPIVAEVQLGYHLVEGLYLISEYRINQYRRSDVNNLAIGVEYKLTW